MDITIAGDLVLLAYDDQSGKAAVDSTGLHAAIAGAAILELTMQGALTIDDVQKPVKKQRLSRDASMPVADPVMAEIADFVDGRKVTAATSAVSGVASFKARARNLKDALLEQLAEQGVLREEAGRVLGLFPTTRWPAVDPSHEDALRQRLRAALLGQARPEERDAALISLLSAAGMVAKVFPQEDKKTIEATAKQIAESDWAAAGVKQAIDAVNSAMVTVLVTSSITATSN